MLRQVRNVLRDTHTHTRICSVCNHRFDICRIKMHFFIKRSILVALQRLPICQRLFPFLTCRSIFTTFDAADIEPMITYGTNPGMGMGITQHIPTTDGMGEAAKTSFLKSMDYMGFQPGEGVLGKKIDYVFLGACTNGRIEDFRAFASLVKGHKKAEHVVAWLVPGSWMVDEQIREEGLDKVLEEAGFAIRQPGCSACLAMNDDKVPAGMYAVSTSNRNFEGRQGPGSRTLLASPLVAAAAAVTGVITDPRELM